VDQLDQQILNKLQQGLSLEASPFKHLAAELEIDVEQLLERIKKLKSANYIRRLGGVFNSKELGYQSTLVALEAEENNFYQIAKFINQHPGVTHNYRRTNRLNLWFTLTTETAVAREAFLAKVVNQPGVKNLYQLPKEKFFKLNVFFDMKSDSEINLQEDGIK
jgi:DNA-binding Lrp family transcriptional regulator